MAKKTRRTRIERETAASYAAVGDEFYLAAGPARRESRWNAAALLLIHSSIAYADAVGISRRGEKSTSDNHMDALALLQEATAGLMGRDAAFNHLRKIMEEKNRASYTGQSFRAKDVESLQKHAERFREWARELLES